MKPIILSLGGSIIVPEQIDTTFLEHFQTFIHEQVEKGQKFVIVAGGGNTARNYQQAADTIIDVDEEDLDWLGIHATRLNAHLLRTILCDIAYPRIITKMEAIPTDMEEPVMIAAGWKPGNSTDYVAVRIAEKLDAEMVINMSNIRYVYDKDPKTYADAKPLESITWEAFRKLVGDEWDPGLHAPFDPIASKFAEEQHMRVVIVKGTDIDALKSWIENASGTGTLIAST